MNRIKTQTGTSVISLSDTADSDVIRIEGDFKGMKAAMQPLLEIASKMVCVSVCAEYNIIMHVAAFKCVVCVYVSVTVCVCVCMCVTVCECVTVSR